MSAKGTHWSKNQHKYLRIENGRYIYKENEGSDGNNSSQSKSGKGFNFDIDQFQETDLGKGATKFLFKGQATSKKQYESDLRSFGNLSEGEQMNYVLSYTRNHSVAEMMETLDKIDVKYNKNLEKYEESIAAKCYMNGLTPEEAKFVLSVKVGESLAAKEINSMAAQTVKSVKKEVSDKIAGVKQNINNKIDNVKGSIITSLPGNKQIKKSDNSKINSFSNIKDRTKTNTDPERLNRVKDKTKSIFKEQYAKNTSNAAKNKIEKAIKKTNRKAKYKL